MKKFFRIFFYWLVLLIGGALIGVCGYYTKSPYWMTIVVAGCWGAILRLIYDCLYHEEK